MTDEELRAMLDAVGPEDGPEDGELDPRWEALAMGELEDEERGRLAQLAAASPTAADLLDLYEPLDEEALARATERVLALRPAEPAPVVFGKGAWSNPEAEAAPPGMLAQILAVLRRPVLVAPILALAGLLLVVGPLTRSQGLPDYDASWRSGDRLQRSDETLAGPGRTFSPGSRVEVVLTPLGDVDGPVTVQTTLMVAGEALSFSPTVEVTEDGLVRVLGTLPTAGLVEGEGVLQVRLSSADAERMVSLPLVLTAQP